jgi:hypothetical protein
MLCLGCGRDVTERQARAAFAFMIELGLSTAEARSKWPRCFSLCAPRARRQREPGGGPPCDEPMME